MRPRTTITPGMIFGRWTVLSGPLGRYRWYFECRCSCGRERTVFGGSLTRGASTSCGCYAYELTGKRARRHGDARPGSARERLYNIWATMRQRCENPHSRSYARYGARGITVCNAWRRYPAFRKWALSAGYAPTLTIDRIDNDQGYRPSNCRWITIQDQQHYRASRQRKNGPHGRVTIETY